MWLSSLRTSICLLEKAAPLADRLLEKESHEISFSHDVMMDTGPLALLPSPVHCALPGYLAVVQRSCASSWSSVKCSQWGLAERSLCVHCEYAGNNSLHRKYHPSWSHYLHWRWTELSIMSANLKCWPCLCYMAWQESTVWRVGNICKSRYSHMHWNVQ